MNRNCPSCGNKTLANKVVENFSTSFEGIPIIVPSASFRECTECEKRTFPAKELKRWRKIKDDFLATSICAVTGSDVQALREQLGLSVASFADLISVTRQTGHNWEKEKERTLKANPASLLIALMSKELSGAGVGGVIGFLRNAAAAQGNEIEVNVPPSESPQGSKMGPRLKKVSACFPRFYDPAA